MNLVFTDEQRIIREEARRFLADRSSSESLRRVVEEGAGFDAGLWTTVAGELGWCAMTIPEAHGGIGLGMTELVILMEAAGERLAPIPLWSTACASAPLLMAVASEGAQAELLPRLAEGELAVAVAWGDPGALDPLAATSVAATPSGDGYVLDGRVSQVIDCEAADIILVPARLSDRIALFALERGAGQEVRRLRTLDCTRQVGELTLRKLRVTEATRIDGGDFASTSAAEALAVANLGLAAEQIGATRGVLDVTLAYIGERIQFGRTIASFQAIKHRCARLDVDIAEARALVYGAAANFEAASAVERMNEIGAARALASDLLFRASEEAIQLHGGVGFTWEYDPHLYFKRAQGTFSLLGTPEMQFERIAAGLIDESAAA